MKYIPLKPAFTERGFTYERIRRDGDLAVYRARRDNWPDEDNTYEVIRIQFYPDREIGGKEIGAAEAYPPASRWGQHGWSFREMSSALDKYHDLLKARDKIKKRRT